MAGLWGLIFEGLVVDVVPSDPTGRFAETIVTTDISQVTPQPEVGWTAAETNGAWSFTAPPVPPAPTLAQQATAALLAGCQVVSTGTPALDGTYACDAETRADIMAETVSLLLNSSFTNGEATIQWPDTSGAQHAFSADAFKPFATAIAAYVGALKAIAGSGGGSLPVQPITIA